MNHRDKIIYDQIADLELEMESAETTEKKDVIHQSICNLHYDLINY